MGRFLHFNLLSCLDYFNLQLMLMLFMQQMVQRKLAFLNKSTKGGRSCWILLVIAVVILIVVIWQLFQHL
jgi:hypothetical protein